MNIGKLSNEDLQRIILDKLTNVRDDILVRAGIGEDCAVVDFGEDALVISSDPITGTSANLGKIALNINCNDIAASGGEPVGVMITILAPPETTLEELGVIMDEASGEARKLGVEILGGHTEITDAVNRIVISATAIGKVKKSSVAASRKVKGGDVLIMTKCAGLEGTGIIAYDLADRLSDILNDDEMLEARSMLEKISVVEDGFLAAKAGAIFMHDITEGGVLGAIWELCEATGLGCEIVQEAITVEAVTIKICSHLGIDPYKLISSGSMLIAASEKDCNGIIDSLSQKGIKSSRIGELTDEKVKFISKCGTTTVIESPESDELYKVI